MAEMKSEDMWVYWSEPQGKGERLQLQMHKKLKN